MIAGFAPFSPLVAAALVFAGGLCLGSFASAMAYRLPRDIRIGGASRSACPHCTHALGLADLLPVVSWLALRGRCRYCRTPIGWQYPVIELSTALLCLALYMVFGFSLWTLPVLLLAPVLVAMADIDFRHKIIPDGLNLSVFLLGLAALALSVVEAGGGMHELQFALLPAAGGVVLYGLGSFLLRLVVMRILKKDPMGWGDIKFFAAAGVWLGYGATVLAYFLLVSGLSGVVLALLWKRMTGEEEFPFGPSLLLAFVTVLMAAGPVFVG